MSRALATAALGIGLCLAGATFDTPSLYVPGVALAGTAIAASAWVRLAARGARVTRAPGPHTVVEEEPWPLRLQLTTGMLPPPGGELLEPLLGWPVPVAGRWARRLRLNVRFSRRGRRCLEAPVLVVRDPLGLDRMEIWGEGGEELLVLPRIEPVEPVRRGGAGAGTAEEGEQFGPSRRLDRSTAELEIDGLRPYRQGAPASRIHWPAVARSGEMLERRLVAGLDAAPLIVLDACRPAGEEALDAAVRAAGSLCAHLARAGGCAILLPGERRPVEVGADLGAWPTVHVRLALVEGSPAPPALSRAGRGGAVIWVTARAQHRAPGALERLPAGSRWLVTPHSVGDRTPAFTVAGCEGVRLDRVRRPMRPTRREAA
ncbi:MAG TPA: DUF58 domain-containing protein [Thermoleophilaceae bacterium]|nr:DUF58 domain-containing protein [Thermoleophilaceae bacterium]